MVFADFDFLQYFLLGFACKGRVATQKNIKDDPTRPNIAFFIVILIQNLRSDIIGLLIKKT